MSWRLSDGVRLSAFENAAFILDISRSRYLSLNDTAKEVCVGIQQHEPTERIIARVQLRYRSESAEEVASDVRGFLRRLETMGICTRDDT